MFFRLKHMGWIALLLCSAAGCYLHKTPKSDGESRFLFPCNESCADGLECICGVCARFCDDQHECVALQKKASCIDGADYPMPLWCSDLKHRAICDLECTSDSDCLIIGPRFECTKNFCRVGDSKENSPRVDPQVPDGSDSSQDDLVNPQDASELDVVSVANDGDSSMDATVAQTKSDASHDVSESDTRGKSSEVEEVDDSGASDDEKDAEQPPDEDPLIERLYGNRYTVMVTREWDGSTALSHLPWEAGWEELPEADFDSIGGIIILPLPVVSVITTFTLTLSDDGRQITLDDEYSSEQTSDYTGTRTEQSDYEAIYEVSSIDGASNGRMRVWIDGSDLYAEWMVYGSESPIALCQRGVLLSDSGESDEDCSTGSVCEPRGCGSDQKGCFGGCHNDSDCNARSSCEQILLCLCAPCPAQCVTPSTNDTECELDPDDPDSIDLDAFIEMAKSTSCAESRNSLYLIDCSLIFWTWEGNCSDHAYGDFLFGHSPDEIYCSDTDLNGDPLNYCEDPDYRLFFYIMTSNRDDPYLGLIWGHDVQQIPL